MSQVFDLIDDLGPSKALHISTPGADLRAIVVIDNVAAGPAIGGVRMAKDATLRECARLARAMTLKNAIAGLPHGGAKSVILADPEGPVAARERQVRAFARAVANETDYIPGPDMGLDERAMAWVHDEIGRAVGLPRELGGIALDENGATGYGVTIAAEAAEALGGPEIDGARVVVQGFGAVGMNAARFLAERGAVLVAAADSHGAVADPGGLDIEALARLTAEGRSVADSPDGVRIDHDALIDVECEFWIPAARPDVLTEANVGRLRTRVVIQGANIPATDAAETMMMEAGILNIPDFVANAGGVIGGAVEYRGGGAKEAFAMIEEKIRRNATEVLTRADAEGIAPRAAAAEIAVERVRAAMALRRFARPSGE